MLGDYAERMARTLGQPIDAPQAYKLPAFPRPRDQAVNQPDTRLGLRDAWAVRDCMGQLIALRNSGLGRVMQPSQRLAYESQFQAQASACLDELANATDEVDREQRAVLRTIIDSKRGAAVSAAQAFVQRDTEMATFWRLPARPLANDPPPVRADALEQVADAIEAVVAGQAIDGGTLEQALEALQGSTSLGQIAQAEALAIAWLDAITAAIHARLDRRPLCFDAKPTPDARVLQNIFTAVYAGKVQPWLAELQRAGQAARPVAQRVLAPVSGAFGPAMQAYQAKVVRVGANSSQSAFLAATRAHSEAWQRLLKQCGMMPAR